jgi:hypothetical protein
VGGQLHYPAALSPWVRAPGTHWMRGWVGPRAGLNTVAKMKKSCHCSCREFNPEQGKISMAVVTVIIVPRPCILHAVMLLTINIHFTAKHDFIRQHGYEASGSINGGEFLD